MLKSATKELRIVENGTYDFTVDAGSSYVIGVSGTAFGTNGSLAISWVDSAGVATPFPDSPLVANGGFMVYTPTNKIRFVLTSTAGTPNILLSIASN